MRHFISITTSLELTVFPALIFRPVIDLTNVVTFCMDHTQWPRAIAISQRISYRKILQNVECPRIKFRIFQSLWNLADVSTAVLPKHLLNVQGIWAFWQPISLVRDFMRSCEKQTPDCVVGNGHNGTVACDRFWSFKRWNGRKLILGQLLRDVFANHFKQKQHSVVPRSSSRIRNKMWRWWFLYWIFLIVKHI